MDLEFSMEDERFRRRLRSWLRKHLSKRGDQVEGGEGLCFSSAERVATARRWQRQMFDAGYVGLEWPRAYGGQEAGLVRQAILDEELAAHHAPPLIGQLGLRILGPTLIRYGTDEQRRRFLAPILTAEELWGQGDSEPGPGSDLASPRTRAEIDGDFFVVSGQKISTTTAQFADWMFCLVQTDPTASRHRGISYLLIDMRSPGVEVRPLAQMGGEPGSGEVFLTDVRVPRANLVGELNDGWVIVNATLAHERNMLASITRTQQLMADLVRLARRRKDGGGKASRDPWIRQKLADLQIRAEMMKLHSWKQISDEMRGRPTDATASINTLVTTELNHEICATALDLLGDYGPLCAGSPHAEDRGAWPREWMSTLGLTIGGGTSQIQKNLIAERVLGLPRGA